MAVPGDTTIKATIEGTNLNENGLVVMGMNIYESAVDHHTYADILVFDANDNLGQKNFSGKEKLEIEFGVPEGKKRKTVFEKEVEFGKEYSLTQPLRREGNTLRLAPKITVIGRNLGGEYEVRLPNGVETFLSPEQFRNYELTDTSVEENVLQDMMDKSIDAVLNKKKYADIVKPTEDKLQYVNSLDNSELVDDIQDAAITDASATTEAGNGEISQSGTVKISLEDAERRARELDTIDKDLVKIGRAYV